MEKDFFSNNEPWKKPDLVLVKSTVNSYLDELITKKRVFTGLKLLIRGFTEFCLHLEKDNEELELIVQDLDQLKQVLLVELSDPSPASASNLQSRFKISQRLMKHFYQTALEIHQSKRIDDAIAAFLVLSCLDPLNDLYWLCLGICEQQAKDLNKAEKAYEVAIQVNPQNPANYIYQAQCHVQKDELSQAETFLSKAMQRLWHTENPDTFRVHIHRLHKEIARLKDQ